MSPERNLIFLRYARKDLDKAEILYNGLKKRGLNLWIDKCYHRSILDPPKGL